MLYEAGSPELRRPSWLRALLADGHAIAVIAVTEGRVTAANRSADALFGTAVTGCEAVRLFDEGSRAKFEMALAGEPGTWELSVCRAGHAPEPVRFVAFAPTAAGERAFATAIPLPLYSDGAPYKLLRANDELANLTRELAKQMQALEQVRAELVRLGTQRDEFIAMLSHDLRSPLSAQVMVADLLERKAERITAAEVRDSAVRVKRNASRMLAFVDSTLDDARMDTGHLELRRERVALRDIATAAIEAIEPLAAMAHVAIAVAPSSAPGNVDADPTRLLQVLANLIENAVRHSPAHTCVDVLIEDGPGWVRCSVSDAGAGVAEDQRQSIFDRYRQGETRGSLGLGLYVARMLIELHGGRVWVEDRPGGGARFVIELPRPHPSA